MQVNPNFAPAYAFLSVAYRQQKETKEKALAAGMQAAKLDPTGWLTLPISVTLFWRWIETTRPGSSAKSWPRLRERPVRRPLPKTSASD